MCVIRNNIYKSFLALVGFALAALSYSTVAQSEEVSADLAGQTCFLFSEKTEYVDFDLHLRLRNDEVASFRVPLEYFEYNRTSNSVQERFAELFRVEIENFEPVSAAEAARRNKDGIWDWMLVLVQSTISLEKIALSNARISSFERRDRIEDYQLIPYDFDLLKIDHEVKPLTKETFVASLPDGSLSDVFACSTIGNVPFPSCSQHFKYQHVSVQVSYRRIELSKWRDIRAKVEQFLSCVIIK